ncbi:MAG: CAP domain-containing protein, partial [Acidimicrobiales bacterium]
MRTNRRMLTGAWPGMPPGMPTRERFLPACLARFVLLAALLAAGFTVVAQSPAGATTTTSASTVSPLADPAPVTPAESVQETQFNQDINAERAARGESTLAYSSYLQQLAQAYVDYETSLTGPPWASGSTLQFDDIGVLWESAWITAHPCTAAVYGACPLQYNGGTYDGAPLMMENVGSVEVSSVPSGVVTGSAVVALMESEPHRDTMLANGWTMIGAGSVCSSAGWMTDVLFGTQGAPDTVTSPVTPQDPIVTSPLSGMDPCPPPVSNFAPPGQIVDIASTPSGNGYWTVDSLGYVGAYGAAVNYGGMGGAPLNAPISHIVSTPDGFGYWLVAADGGVFCFGDAQFYGSMGGKPLNAPVMDIIPTSNGAGYWLVATDGGVFSFGNAQFYGSMGGHPLNAPVNGGSFAQGGYRMVANDGGIFDFGGAQFYGSMGGHPLNQPIVGMADTPDGAGYWEVAA